MKALKYCRTASFVPMMAFLIVFFVYRTLNKGFDGILATTTYMFCGMLLVEWLIQKFSYKDFSLGLVHWLSFALAVALFEELIKMNKEDENALVIAAECEDMQTAEGIWNKLESNGIKAKIVEKDSPIYIKGNDSPVQIQVCRKDIEKSKEII